MHNNVLLLILYMYVVVLTIQSFAFSLCIGHCDNVVHLEVPHRNPNVTP